MALRRSPAARMHRAGRQRRGGRDVAEPRPVALLSLGCSPLQREVPHCTQPRARPWRHRAVWAAPAARTCRCGRAGLYRRLLATAVPTQACPRVVLTVAASVAWPTLRLPPAWREVIDAAVTTRQRSPSSWPHNCFHRRPPGRLRPTSAPALALALPLLAGVDMATSRLQ